MNLLKVQLLRYQVLAASAPEVSLPLVLQEQSPGKKSSKVANPIQQEIKEPATNHELDRWHESPNLQHDTSHFGGLPDLSVECLHLHQGHYVILEVRDLALVPAL